MEENEAREYTERDLIDLKENRAFQAFMKDVKDRITIVQSELETAPKESLITVSEGKLSKLNGCEFHQGELASLRFFENAVTILKEDLEGGASDASRS